MGEKFTYPTTEDIIRIHRRIVENSGVATEPGVRNESDVRSAITRISVGFFGESPDGIHLKAAYLAKDLVASHPFVDANKRTALTSVALFYQRNGYQFHPDGRVREYLKEIGVDHGSVNADDLAEYFETRTEPTN